jgi:hypothetical protein
LVVLPSRRLGSGLIGPVALLHGLAAVHAAIAVPIGAAIGHVGVAVMLAVPHLAVLYLAMVHLAVLLMLCGRGLRRRGRLGSGGERDDERNRGDDDLHVHIS